MSIPADDPVRAEVERALRRVVDVTIVAPWMLATWGPRCVLKRLGSLARTGAPASAVRTVVDLAQQATSPSETSMAGYVSPAPVAGSTEPRAAAEADETPDAPGAATLPIEDYESLAASQVVTRLAALTPEGLVEVREFESAHRGRRTIIGKIDQLLS